MSKCQFTSLLLKNMSREPRHFWGLQAEEVFQDPGEYPKFFNNGCNKELGFSELVRPGNSSQRVDPWNRGPREHEFQSHSSNQCLMFHRACLAGAVSSGIVAKARAAQFASLV